MFEGYMRFGGVEVVNVARAAAYAKAGCVPDDFDVDPQVPCEGLADALGHAAYTMPALDAAPWFDAGNPDTHWFGGVIPLEVGGLDGSTRKAEVGERLGDGGVVTLARRTTRTIPVSALLIGRDAASVHAGLEWLTTVLSQGCDSTDSGCGQAGARLELFTQCPGPVVETENDTAPVVAYPQDPAGAWLQAGGRWEPGALAFRVDAGTTGGDVVVDGGTPASTSGGVDGGAPGTSFTGTTDGGNPGSEPVVGLLATPQTIPCRSFVSVSWVVAPLGAEAEVSTGAVDRYGETLWRSGPRILTGPTTITREFTDEEWIEDGWRAAIWSNAPGLTVTSVTVRYRPSVSREACIAPYRRAYENVSLVEAPQVVKTYESNDSDGRIVQVEWTWVAADPYRYAEPLELIRDLPGSQNAPPAAVTLGVTSRFLGQVPGVPAGQVTDCPRPVSSAGTCGMDPTYPTFQLPPAGPVVKDPAVVRPTSYDRTTVTLERSVVPNGGAGALSLTIRSLDGTAKRGIRVRLYVGDDFGDVTDVTECSFESELWVDYLRGSSTLVIDGPSRSVSVICPDGSVADARTAVRGPYGGAFRFPEVRCDRRYFLALDTPTGQGKVAWSLSMTPREG